MTISELKSFKKLKISDYNLNELSDILDTNADLSKTSVDRIVDFLGAVNNPYVFKVDNNPVMVRFVNGCLGNTIKDSLKKIIENQI